MFLRKTVLFVQLLSVSSEQLLRALTERLVIEKHKQHSFFNSRKRNVAKFANYILAPRVLCLPESTFKFRNPDYEITIDDKVALFFFLLFIAYQFQRVVLLQLNPVFQTKPPWGDETVTACGQSKEIPCWVSRPWEKTLFVFYMSK